MKVVCIANTGEYLTRFGQLPEGVSPETIFGAIQINKEYFVLGILHFEDHLSFLSEDDGFVFALPSRLFKVSDSKICKNWYFNKFSSNRLTNLLYVQGYDELVFNNHHYENLFIQEEEALKIFFQRKKEFYEN